MKTKSEILTKFAVSATKEGIISLINKFYYSTTFTVYFETGEVSNKNGLVKGIKVSFIKGRFIFHSVAQSLAFKDR